MKKNKLRNILIITFMLVAPALWMTKVVMDESTFECRVCMSFKGNQNCAKAIGRDQESCVSTARDNACALIASGMTDTIQCAQTPPSLVE
ncbi:MAG: hypothetical protein IT286_05510 [Proteobacteria bacterium]|jgi:hypothetical protein|nr:hypothetical protein [Pseudomonadota bacterium]